MKLTQPGKDVIKVGDEEFEKNKVIDTGDKVHLVKFDFTAPTKEKVDWVLHNYPDTKRFIVEDDIKTYNDILKVTPKKYYVENKPNTGLLTFFRKNNKVLLNFINLLKEERDFILDYLLFDILKNVEIIILDETSVRNYYEQLKKWSGNVIVYNPDYEI